VGVGDALRRAVEYLTTFAQDDTYEEDEEIAPPKELEPYDRQTLDARSRDRRRSDEGGEFDKDASPTHRSRERERSVRSLALVSSPRGEVQVVVPQLFEDAQQIADKFRADRTVIVNVQSCPAELASRLLDFCSGLTYALGGGLQRIDEKVFLLTPGNVEVSADTVYLRENGFFNQV
jgi:cell division inhibitor SepF